MVEKLSISVASDSLHIGCGTIILNNFVNIDKSLTWYSDRIVDDTLYNLPDLEAWILQYDVRKGLPAKANSIANIYHSHFLEHLTREEGFSFLTNCYRVLKPGGSMRICMPDLRIWCSSYIENRDEFFDLVKKSLIYPSDPYSNTNAAILNLTLYSFGHKCLYDFTSISAMLTMIGFANINHVKWGISEKIQGINKAETLDSAKRNESLVVECQK